MAGIDFCYCRNYNYMFAADVWKASIKDDISESQRLVQIIDQDIFSLF